MPPHNGTRVASLLHYYRLRASQTQRLAARSDLHDGAHVRMHPEDVEALARPADSLRPMVALFSTASASEPVCLRSAETVYVRPGRARRAHDASQRGQAWRELERAREEQRHTVRPGAAPLDAAARSAARSAAQSAQQGAADAEWIPLRVAASHAYVRGLRVSGTIHRAVVRLVRET